MEKRKLAQIPREEATDEMVRFAERAAGTHIVTTRDIEKDLCCTLRLLPYATYKLMVFPFSPSSR